MADDDFDFEIYGDENNQEYNQSESATDVHAQDEAAAHENTVAAGDHEHYDESYNYDNGHHGDESAHYQEGDTGSGDPSGDASGQDFDQTRQSSQTVTGDNHPGQQGTKRKNPGDNEPLEPGAAAALVIGELEWWISDDIIRGWANKCNVEDQLKELTFSEHKVNGKSKGSVFAEFETPAASNAVKHFIEALMQEKEQGNKYTVHFQSPSVNPFKNPPKDHGRKDQQAHQGGRGSMNQGGFGGRGNFQNRGNFNRGGGMGYGNRGGYNQNVGGGMNQNFGGGFNNPMGSFNAGMGGIGNFGNFNRGGMMGGGMGMRGGMANRGGRGGMGGFNPMMGGMGGMGMNMPMGNMGMMGGMPNQGKY